MTGTKAIKTALEATGHLFTNPLNDLSDADLLVRPVPGANHIAWQIGHIITSEIGLVTSQIPDAKFPELPTGFKDTHGMKQTGADTGAFLTKAEYVDLFNKTRAATIAAVEKLTDADLDKPTSGNMAAMAPTLGAWLLLVSNHTLMHGSQFSVVRRKLGKPVLF
ncbi:MAG: DinB family protein [Gemmataceae bacterium]